MKSEKLEYKKKSAGRVSVWTSTFPPTYDKCLASLSCENGCQEHFKQLKILTVVSLYISETIVCADSSTHQLSHHNIH